MGRFRNLLVFALVASAALAVAQPGGKGERRKETPLPPLLMAVVKAGRTTVYAGIREVYFRKPDGKEMKGRERVLRAGTRLRVEFAPGSPYSGQVIVEDGRLRRHFNPETNEIKERPMFFDPLSTGMGPSSGPMGRMMGGVTYSLEGNSTVAGVPVQGIKVQSGRGMVLQRIWVDTARSVILKRKVYDPSGNVLAGFEFLSIKYDPKIPPTAFELKETGAKRVTPESELAEAASELGMKAMRIPASTGWVLAGVRRIDNEKMRIISQTYRNGRGRVTLFMVKGKLDGERLSRMGGGRLEAFTWSKEGVSLALLGPLPQEDLRALSLVVSASKP